MSVIITGITSDIKCIDCPMRDLDDNCLAQKYESETWEEMKAGCPLKSIDGLIEKVEQLKKSCANDSYGKCMANAISRVEKLIKEYCEVTE